MEVFGDDGKRSTQIFYALSAHATTEQLIVWVLMLIVHGLDKIMESFFPPADVFWLDNSYLTIIRKQS